MSEHAVCAHLLVLAAATALPAPVAMHMWLTIMFMAGKGAKGKSNSKHAKSSERDKKDKKARRA